MTRKDYESVAAMFLAEVARIKDSDYGRDRVVITTTVKRLADAFADRAIADNPRFKRDTFMRACGLA